MLPNFLCIGAPKSGTTTLYDVLKQHSDIFLPSFKEPHFFDTQINWEKGIDWYHESYYSNTKKTTLIGDFTPTYLAHPKAPIRIYNSLNKDVKFIVILRNPTIRAYSHYLHSCRDNYESLSFEDALSEEKNRLLDLRDENAIIRFGYSLQGKYAQHLKNYFTKFERKNFFILTFDEYISDQKKYTKEILSFLGVSKNEEINYNLKSNVASKARSNKLKNILKKPSFLKSLAKNMIPSVSLRQKIRNKIQYLNNKPTLKDPLSLTLKKKIYNEYFKKDINDLEKLLSLNLTIWKYD